jgi:hypothetical protein
MPAAQVGSLATHNLNARWPRLTFKERSVDEDIQSWSRELLIDEVRRLRAGIRAHRDSSGHDLCWHHPQLWGLLPERIKPDIAVSPWPNFIRGCVRYRESLDKQLPGAPVADVEYKP